MHALGEFGQNHPRVAGVLAIDDRYVGREFVGLPVLGTVKDINDVIENLAVHGVFIKKIVVTLRLSELASSPRSLLLKSEVEKDIVIEILSETMGLEDNLTADADDVSKFQDINSSDQLAFVIPQQRLDILSKRYFWKIKRLFDVIVASSLIILFSPIIVIVALLVLLDIGNPMLFWQQRPGLGGRAFRVYKFRTMGPAHDSSGARIADENRSSAIGRFLRRTRLDELPQLFSILNGDMSFVGPRPLLPIDQPYKYRARLLVRPGLTGWAQVKGGRILSASDKAAMDVWYVENASLLLDLKILALTVHVVIFGERPSRASIEKAWSDLRHSGVYMADFDIVNER